MGFLSRISGDDIFISYSRQDGALYAAGLAEELTDKKFSCFIDKLGVKPNHDLPPELIQKIKNCNIFVVVATEKAAGSLFVQKEVRAFRETGRTILPIDFDGSFGRAIWYDDVPGLAAEAERDADALIKGDPSDNVIRFIEKSFNYTRRNQRMARTFWLTAVILMLLIALSVAGIFVARSQIAKAAAATAKADQETDRANRATALANAKTTEAAQRTLEAQQATDAAQTAKNEATRQKGFAEDATKLAKEKTAQAAEATRKAADAAEKQRQAEALEEKGRVTLARNYFNSARLASSSNSLEAALWAQRAIETLPKTNENLSTYARWTLNEIDRMPKLVVNPPHGIGQRVVYSAQYDRAITVSPAGDLNVWNLKTGTELNSPLTDCRLKVASLYITVNARPGIDRFDNRNPIFSPDGRYIAAIVEELSQPSHDLLIWETDTARVVKAEAVPGTEPGYEGYFRFSPDGRFIVAASPMRPSSSIALLVWRTVDGKFIRRLDCEAFYYYAGDLLSAQTENSRRDLQVNFPLITYGAKNLILTFYGEESPQTAIVYDIENGEQFGEKIPLKSVMEYINFAGSAGRVVMIYRDRKDYSGEPNDGTQSLNGVNLDSRMITAWDPAANTFITPARFATSINQEYKIAGFSKDGNRLIVDPSNVSLALWCLSSSGLCPNQPDAPNYFQFMVSKKNLRAFFTDDESQIVTIADSFDSPDSLIISSDRVRQDILIMDVRNGFSRRYFQNERGVIDIPPTGNGFFSQIGDVLQSRDLTKFDPVNSSTDVGHIKLRQDRCLFRVFRIPGTDSVITFSGACFPTSTPDLPPAQAIEMQRWNLATGRPEWEGREISLGESPGGFNFQLGNLVFDPTAKTFATLVEAKTDSALDRRKVLRLWDTATGNPRPNISPTSAPIESIAFRRDGSSLVMSGRSVNGETTFSTLDLAPGGVITDIPSLAVSSSQEIYGFAENGRFAIIAQRYKPNSISLYDLDRQSFVQPSFCLKNRYAASWAIELLKQSTTVTLDGSTVVGQTTKGLSFEVTAEGELSLVQKDGSREKITAEPWDNYFKIGSVSPSGRSVMKAGTTTASLLDSATALPIVESDVSAVFAEILPDEKGFLTIDYTGAVRQWRVLEPTPDLSSWLSDLGPALSGMQIKNDVSAEPMAQSDYLTIRERYLEGLKNTRNPEAAIILKRWNPQVLPGSR